MDLIDVIPVSPLGEHINTPPGLLHLVRARHAFLVLERIIHQLFTNHNFFLACMHSTVNITHYQNSVINKKKLGLSLKQYALMYQ